MIRWYSRTANVDHEQRDACQALSRYVKTTSFGLLFGASLPLLCQQKDQPQCERLTGQLRYHPLRGDFYGRAAFLARFPDFRLAARVSHIADA